MKKCECGNEMNQIYLDHQTAYYEIHWCKKCGRLLEINEDETDFMRPLEARPVADPGIFGKDFPWAKLAPLKGTSVDPEEVIKDPGFPGQKGLQPGKKDDKIDPERLYHVDYVEPDIVRLTPIE